MSQDVARRERVTLSTLKERGWTDGAVRRFLGEPDVLVPNPHRRSGPKMRLFDLGRVEAVESGEDRRSWRERTRPQRQNASERQKIRMERLRAELVGEVNEIEIVLPGLDKKKLFRLAVENRNAQAEWYASERGRYDYEHASLESADNDALERWAVNYLRHAETDYDWLLDRCAGRVGVDEARSIIRDRVLNEIARRYPYLAAECSRQLAAR